MIQNEKGYTLIELIAVVVIIGIAVVVILGYIVTGLF